MIIKKIIPESSIDYKGEYGPVMFLQGCNFRCGFCHNADLTENQGNLSLKEIENLDIKDMKIKSKNKWYTGITITGGEPLIHKNIVFLLKKLKLTGLKIKLDTNGSNPGLLKKVIDMNLVNYVALDIKCPKKMYKEVAGVNIDLTNIEKTIKILCSSNVDFEFRTTLIPVVKEKRWLNEKEIKDMVKWVYSLCKKGNWCLQEFVSRSKNEILSEDYSEELLPGKLKQTPEDLLIQTKNIIKEKFNCEIV